MKDFLFPFRMMFGQEPRQRFWWFWVLFLVLITPLMWIAVVALGLWQAPIEAWHWVRRRLVMRRLRARVAAAFPGQSLEDVVAAAPYRLGHNQGDDGYYVYDQRAGPSPPYLESRLSRRAAEAFVVEMMLAERA